MIYISTGGFSEQTARETAAQLMQAEIRHIELSGGKGNPTQIDDLVSTGAIARYRVHNYFPPPEIPFVFNLASLDKKILEKSIQLAQTAIALAKNVNSPTYSFHAGFLLDPKVSQLGRKITKGKLFDRESAIAQFCEVVNFLARFAENHNVNLLIENNVISKDTLADFDENPLLMTTANECAHIMSNTADNVGLLIDVAHLNVSAHTLGLNKIDFLKICEPWVQGYHLSENDGLRDSNEKIREESWFWRYLKRDLNYYVLEVYGLDPLELKKQQTLAEHILEKHA